MQLYCGSQDYNILCVAVSGIITIRYNYHKKCYLNVTKMMKCFVSRLLTDVLRLASREVCYKMRKSLLTAKCSHWSKSRAV